MSAGAEMRPLVLEPGFHLVSDAPPRVPGSQRRYELLCVLARGGTAMVWLARTKDERGADQLVAVKTILPEHAKNEKLQRLVVEESRIVAAITDRYVVRMLDAGQQGEVAFLVMELVDGESLRALHHVLRKKEMTIPVPVALRIAADVCAGLAAAHTVRGEGGRSLGIIHRDVSPENVLIGMNGDARLVDFGIAKARSRAPTDTTAAGIAGRPDFLAPEVALGIDADVRADLWSAGALLYWMLAGRPPYGDTSAMATLHALASYASVPPLPTSIPEATRSVVSVALQHDRDRRFTRAAAMHTAVEEAASASGGMASHDDVGLFLATTLKDRIAGRHKAIDRALTEAARRAQVHASLMQPPEILPAGEQTTPLRAAAEAAEAAALSTVVPSSDGATGHFDAPTTEITHIDTSRPPSTQRYPSLPTPAPPAVFAAEPGTRPYQLRPPSRPPRSGGALLAATTAVMPNGPSGSPRAGTQPPAPRTPPPPRTKTIPLPSGVDEPAPITQIMRHAPALLAARVPSEAFAPDAAAGGPPVGPPSAPTVTRHLVLAESELPPVVQTLSQMPPVATLAGTAGTAPPPPYLYSEPKPAQPAFAPLKQQHTPPPRHLLDVMHPAMPPPSAESSSQQIATIPPMRGRYGSIVDAPDSAPTPPVPPSPLEASRTFVRVAIVGVALVILLFSFLKYRADHARPVVAEQPPPASASNAGPPLTPPNVTVTVVEPPSASAEEATPPRGAATETGASAATSGGGTGTGTSAAVARTGTGNTPATGTGRRNGKAVTTNRGTTEPATNATTGTPPPGTPPTAPAPPRKNEDYGF